MGKLDDGVRGGKVEELDGAGNGQRLIRLLCAPPNLLAGKEDNLNKVGGRIERVSE